MIAATDRATLHELARRVAEIAVLPITFSPRSPTLRISSVNSTKHASAHI
jgi:hypothetical protein